MNEIRSFQPSPLDLVRLEWPTFEAQEEWRLLLGCLLHPRSRVENHELLAALAEKNGMAPLLYARMAAASSDMQADIISRTKGAALSHRFHFERCRSVFTEAGHRFDEAGIPYRLLKGYAVGRLFYDPPYARPFSDIDWVVPFAAFDDARRLLQLLGFMPCGTDHIDELDADVIHALAFIHREDTSLGIELHHSLGLPAFDTSWLWAKEYHLRLPDEDISTLSAEAHLAFLCGHLYYRHGWEPRLIWLQDIHEGISAAHPQFSWECFVSIVRSAGWCNGAEKILHCLRSFYGSVIPPVVEDIGQSPSVRDWISFHPGKAIGMWGEFYKIRTLQGRLRFLMKNLFPSKSFMLKRYACKYPAFWVLTYLQRWWTIVKEVGLMLIYRCKHLDSEQ